MNPSFRPALFAAMSCLISLSSCKVRGGANPTKETPSDPNSVLESPDSPSVDLSKSPIFVRCSSPKDSSSAFELLIRQDQASGSAQIAYRAGGATEVVTNGMWDNHKEKNPYQCLYSFGELRFIITMEQVSQGLLPSTLVGNDSNGRYIEQNLMCSKS